MSAHRSTLAIPRAAAIAAVVAFGSALSLGVARPLAAQVSVELGPVVGYYHPLGHFGPASVYATDLPTTPQELSGTAWGGQARVWIGSHFGNGAQASVASSTVEQGCTPGPGGCLPSRSARVLAVSARVLYDLSPKPRTYRVWVGVGPVLVRHGGTSYAPYGPPTDFGTSLGAGADVRLIGGLRVSAGVNTLFYTLYLPMPADLQLNGGALEYGPQTDMLLELGATWSVP